MDHDKRASRFVFTGSQYDPATGKARLCYQQDDRELVEEIMFPWAPWPVDASRQAAFYRALELLHLVAGVSYYKAGLARQIDTSACDVDDALAAFLEQLYRKGLAEFAHVNQLDMGGAVGFKANRDGLPKPSDVDLPDRALVAMGGGKDSLVCLEMLRDAGIEVQPACVGGSALIGETVKAAGLPLVRIERSLSPVLIELNAAGAWNGHVPVTAINSAILLCASLLYGYRYIVFANESSANEPTLKDSSGIEINHQYSKSIEFEHDFREMISRCVSPGVEYFSLLRPYNETTIAKRFSALDRYHKVFSSCNRNFHQDGSRIEGRWCQDCPKCRFTALALAPFVSPEQLVAIQGVDLLDDPSQLAGFRALCGLGEQKPFECVGSVAESRALFKHLGRDERWQDHAVIKELCALEEIAGAGEMNLQADASHCIPPFVLDRIGVV
jgi:hypothetical protein